MAFNVKILRNKLNFIHDSILLPVLLDGHPGNIFSHIFKRFWIGHPTVQLLSSEDVLIYPICRGATNSDNLFGGTVNHNTYRFTVFSILNNKCSE